MGKAMPAPRKSKEQTRSIWPRFRTGGTARGNRRRGHPAENKRLPLEGQSERMFADLRECPVS